MGVGKRSTAVCSAACGVLCRPVNGQSNSDIGTMRNPIRPDDVMNVLACNRSRIVQLSEQTIRLAESVLGLDAAIDDMIGMRDKIIADQRRHLDQVSVFREQTAALLSWYWSLPSGDPFREPRILAQLSATQELLLQIESAMATFAGRGS